jgi:hypothetical protein
MASRLGATPLSYFASTTLSSAFLVSGRAIKLEVVVDVVFGTPVGAQLALALCMCVADPERGLALGLSDGVLESMVGKRQSALSVKLFGRECQNEYVSYSMYMFQDSG